MLAPCAQSWHFEAVFAGTVVNIRPMPDTPGVMRVSFNVDARGRGVGSDTVEIVSAVQNGSNCGFTFRLGERYIVYGHTDPSGQLATNMCTGTRLASQAAADIAFIQEVTSRPKGGVRVFGQVRRVEHDLTSPNTRRDNGGVAGARVDLTGDRASRSGVTAPDGRLDSNDLPAGTYRLSVAPPEGLAFAGPPLPPAEHHRSRSP